MDPISDLIECFAAWEPDVRVVGNVKAGDAHDALVALRARVADLESRLSSLDCRYAGAGIGEVSGSHCPADKPCDRCVAERRVAELEAYQRNAGIWMAELIEKIDRYEGALRRVSVPVGESTLDARIAIATNALTA